MKKSLVVGSANFGAKYGAKDSQISRSDVFKIIEDVSRRNNGYIETSDSYPGAERIIGEALGTRKFENIIVKISPKFFSSESLFISAVENSLKNIKQAKVYAVMLHGVGDSLGSSKPAIQAGIKKILMLGLSEKVGVSCYSISEVIETKSAFPEMGIYQLPENIIDKRKYFSKELMDFSASGVIFQVRSIFLQGLLLGKHIMKGSRFVEIQKLQQEINILAKSQNMDSAELCLRYALTIRWASQLVMGFENYEHFRKNSEIVDTTKSHLSFEVTQGSEFLVDPRNWS